MREGSDNSERLFLIAGILLAFLFVWFQWRLIFLSFAGLLLSILLHAIASWIADRTRLRPVPAYLATLFVLAAILTAAGLLLVPRLLSQLTQVATVIPATLHDARADLQRSAWGLLLLRLLHRAAQGDALQFPQIARSIVEGGVDFVIVLVIGFFGALNPRGYREGLLSLVPPRHRERARELSSKVILRLRFWLLGQLIPMTALGVASMIGLWILGVPLAFTIGLLTGVLIFVPYVGSIASGLLAILLALQQGTRTALCVFILYCIFHIIEGYLLTPLVQKRAVRLPPILTVLAEFFLWTVAGVLGVAIAAPLAAAAMVVVEDLYLCAPQPSLNPPEA